MNRKIPILFLALMLLTGCGTIQRFILKTADNTYHKKAAQLVIVQLDDARMEALETAAADAGPKYAAAQAKMNRAGGCDATCMLEVRAVGETITQLRTELEKLNETFSDGHRKLNMISDTWQEEPSETSIHLFDEVLADTKKPLTEMMILAKTSESVKGRKALRARL